MPNTLAHIGAQLPITRLFLKKADPRWIALGLLIPDLPWILQRLLMELTHLSPTAIRAYTVPLSSPFFCLLFSAAICLFTSKRKLIFLILFGHSCMHLTLDALQEKGGVGIPFLAPFHWQAYGFPIFSMDGTVSLILTIVGALCILTMLCKKLSFPGLHLNSDTQKVTICISALLFATYLLLPLLLQKNVFEANVHDLAVWTNQVDRTGRELHFDRATYTPMEKEEFGSIVDSLNPDDPILIKGINLTTTELISTTAIFESDSILSTDHYVVHKKGVRFWYTIVGLLGVISIWTYPILSKFKPSDQGPNTTR